MNKSFILAPCTSAFLAACGGGNPPPCSYTADELARYDFAEAS